jgi:hypothetical protein
MASETPSHCRPFGVLGFFRLLWSLASDSDVACRQDGSLLKLRGTCLQSMQPSAASVDKSWSTFPMQIWVGFVCCCLTRSRDR